MIHPKYKSDSIANITPTVLEHFGCRTLVPSNPVLKNKLRGADKVLFLYLDGLGYDLLKEARAPFLKKLFKGTKPITALFPSTTAASVTSFCTALTPQQHGILSYMLYVKEFRALTNMLAYKNVMTGARLRPNTRTFLPFKTVSEQLAVKGVKTFFLIPKHTVNSTFSRMIHRKGSQVGYHGLREFFQKLKRLLARPGKQFIYAYTDMYDSLCHLYGPYSDAASLFLQGFDAHLEKFVKNVRAKNAVLVISSDHGMLTTDPKRMIDYNDHPKLMKSLITAGGELRMNYLYCRRGRQRFVERYFRKHFGRKAFLFNSRDMLEKEWFGLGAVYPKTINRIGDFVVVAKKNFTFGIKHSPLIGHHGGVSRQEMLVPLLVCKFRS